LTLALPPVAGAATLGPRLQAHGMRTMPGRTAPSYQVLYGFQGLGSSDGVNPQSGVIEVNGVLYGTTQNGTTIQNPGCTGGCGTVYSLTTGGLEAVIYNFTSAGGANPVATLTAVNGALWGTTTTGGASAQNGTVFGLAASGPVMYTFQGSPDGSNPQGAMVYDGKSNLYGTTVGGGTYHHGTVFRISTSGQETVLYSFGVKSGDGAYPYGDLYYDGKQYLYGTLAEGGAHSGGAVFRVSVTGKEKTLYSFACGTDGCNPYSGLTPNGHGSFFGVTYAGGSGSNLGTVYEISKAGKEHVLYRFQGGTDGANPYGGVAYDGKGHVYGTTRYGGGQGFQNNSGTIFEVTVAKKTETIVHAFTGDSQTGNDDGDNPVGDLMYDGQRHLFGTTVQGGSNNSDGSVFEVTL
jgi:uncharacterized repeat protein (TIGR03803 family)